MADILRSIALAVALAGAMVACVRLLLGPGIADRTVGLDAMTVIAVSVIAGIAAMSGRVIYLDVALVYALMSFVGVVAVAHIGVLEVGVALAAKVGEARRHVELVVAIEGGVVDQIDPGAAVHGFGPIPENIVSLPAPPR